MLMQSAGAATVVPPSPPLPQCNYLSQGQQVLQLLVNHALPSFIIPWPKNDRKGKVSGGGGGGEGDENGGGEGGCSWKERMYMYVYIRQIR